MSHSNLPEPLDKACNFLKNKDIPNARKILGIPENQLSNIDFINGLISLEKGIDSAVAGHQSEAFENLKKALPLINLLPDAEIKLILKTIISFCEGMIRLLDGNAHGAFPYFNVSADILEKMSYFNPYLQKSCYLYKAACYVSIARACLNNGDVEGAESKVGSLNNHYSQLLKLLKENNEEDIIYYSEIYGSKVEFSIVFALIDLQCFDFDNMERRLNIASEAASKVQILISNIKYDDQQRILKSLLIMYNVLKDLLDIVKNVFANRNPLTKSQINKLKNIQTDLFNAKNLSREAGIRGQGLVITINRIIDIQSNLLRIGKINKRDFGRFSGIISLVSLVLLIVIVHLIIRPPGFNKPIIFFGELIISLVAGFGYGALRFKSLLGLWSKAARN